jgi:hypothetical protein
VSRRTLPWLLVAVVALLYPLGVVAGGAPRFPSRHDCVHPARSDENVEAVFGRYSTTAAAEAVRERALHSGFKGVQLEADGCGLFKVTLHGIPSLAVGRDFVAEAEKVGFHPSLEQAGP